MRVLYNSISILNKFSFMSDLDFPYTLPIKKKWICNYDVYLLNTTSIAVMIKLDTTDILKMERVRFALI